MSGPDTEKVNGIEVIAKDAAEIAGRKSRW